MLLRATVLPVGFEVMCVDDIEIIDDEDEETGLSSTATSFSENSIRGSKDAVLRIFSGIRAISRRVSEYGGGTSMTRTKLP
jgi:hypothetical protein